MGNRHHRNGLNRFSLYRIVLLIFGCIGLANAGHAEITDEARLQQARANIEKAVEIAAIFEIELSGDYKCSPPRTCFVRTQNSDYFDTSIGYSGRSSSHIRVDDTREVQINLCGWIVAFVAGIENPDDARDIAARLIAEAETDAKDDPETGGRVLDGDYETYAISVDWYSDEKIRCGGIGLKPPLALNRSD